MILNIVTIAPEVDYVMGLYENGYLIIQGDEYHVDISARISGYIKAAERYVSDLSVEYLKISIDNPICSKYIENGECLPFYLPELITQKTKYELQ